MEEPVGGSRLYLSLKWKRRRRIEAADIQTKGKAAFGSSFLIFYTQLYTPTLNQENV